MPVFKDETKMMSFHPDQKFICSDGVLIKCSLVDGSFVPEEIISKRRLLAWVQAQANNSDQCRENQSTSRVHRKLTTTTTDLDQSSWSPYLQQNRRKQSQNIVDASFSPRKISSSSSGILLKSTDDDDQDLDDVFIDRNVPEEHIVNDRQRRERIKDQLLWLTETKGDLVTMETISSIWEAKGFIDVIEEQKMVVAFDVKVNKDSSMTISYQIVHDFKEDFMVLPLNSGHLLFLEPF